jgi:AcrR family transcriptional regulator
MSSDESGTRGRILTAARELFGQAPGAPVSMDQIARRARVSRQALYLHFADRTQLILEVSRVADVTARTPERQRRVDEADTARMALREAIALQAVIKPELRGIATALDVLRRTDPAADAAWQEREHARLRRCEAVVKRLRAEGDLAPRWTVRTAARLLWATTSQRVWDDLVVDQGWSNDHYREHLTAMLEAALLAP